MSRRALAVLLFALALAPLAASAQLFRAYVSIDGSDANPCTLPQPCRLLPAAIAAVASGGQVWMLDSANYNTATVNVTKSVTILAIPGAVGSVVATAGPAINIATPGVNVALRNLVVGPLPGTGGTRGVDMSSGQGLTIEHCLFSNLSSDAIQVVADAVVAITDTTIRNNLGEGIGLYAGARAVVTRVIVSDNGSVGLLASANTTTPVSVDIADSTFSRNLSGIQLSSTIGLGVVKVAVHGSRINDNDNGIVVTSVGGATVHGTVTGSLVTNNVNSGLRVTGAGGRLWVAGNTISFNATGLNNVGGLLESARTNALRNNTTPTSGTITPIDME